MVPCKIKQATHFFIHVGSGTPVVLNQLDTVAMSKLSSLSSQLIHDINVLHYTNTAGSVGIT